MDYNNIGQNRKVGPRRGGARFRFVKQARARVRARIFAGRGAGRGAEQGAAAARSANDYN